MYFCRAPKFLNLCFDIKEVFSLPWFLCKSLCMFRGTTFTWELSSSVPSFSPSFLPSSHFPYNFILSGIFVLFLLKNIMYIWMRWFFPIAAIYRKFGLVQFPSFRKISSHKVSWIFFYFPFYFNRFLKKKKILKKTHFSSLWIIKGWFPGNMNVSVVINAVISPCFSFITTRIQKHSQHKFKCIVFIFWNGRFSTWRIICISFV